MKSHGASGKITLHSGFTLAGECYIWTWPVHAYSPCFPLVAALLRQSWKMVDFMLVLFFSFVPDIRYKGKLFRQSGGPRVARSQRKEIEVAQPDVLKELKVRAQFAEKILAHVTGSDVKVNLRLRRLPDTHPEPLKPKTLGVIFRARLKEPRSWNKWSAVSTWFFRVFF